MTTEAIDLPTHWPPRVSETPFWLPLHHPARIALGVNPRVLVGEPPKLEAKNCRCQCCDQPSTTWRRIYFDADWNTMEPGNWVAYCDRHKEPRTVTHQLKGT